MMPHDVTQADREAAADFHQVYGIGPNQMRRMTADEMRAGEYDRDPLVQAFAAHRLAAIAEERARVVAYLRTRLIANVGDRFADAIERGDHIQEK